MAVKLLQPIPMLVHFVCSSSVTHRHHEQRSENKNISQPWPAKQKKIGIGVRREGDTIALSRTLLRLGRRRAGHSPKDLNRSCDISIPPQRPQRPYTCFLGCALPARSFNPATGRPESLDTAFLRSSTVAVSRSSVTEPLCCPITFRDAIAGLK